MNLSILYRGTLSSCNYGCDYCPFAKHQESRAEHDADHRALTRFTRWVTVQHDHQIGVLFTPWGEALIRKRYQQAFIRLSNLAHVSKVAIQTNLSSRMDWVEECDKSKIALWATYHPTETSRARFVAKCEELMARNVRFSVGVVGMHDHLAEIEALRRDLPTDVYMWVNAYKRVPNYYDETMLDFLTSVDPLFPLNNQYHPSKGHACYAGESAISVDGDGTLRRCHFIKTAIGNIYEEGWEQALQPRPCTNATCGCHIGYVHLPELKLYDVFGDGVLERVPQNRG